MNNIKQFPWYDGFWLRRYYKMQRTIKKRYPEKLEVFTKTMDVFRTDLNFEVLQFQNILEESTLEVAKKRVKAFKFDDFEKHEIKGFGRLIVHNDLFFNELQETLVQFVSEEVGEEVESNYNFLSLYSNIGNCPIHMDAPQAKWTLDICLDQSYEWPIYLSQIEPWPSADMNYEKNWQEEIKYNSSKDFKPYTLQPGNGLLFSGSSQFHYRDRIFRGKADDFCHLVFFHFIPKGTNEFINPSNWGKYFGIPELIVDN